MPRGTGSKIPYGLNGDAYRDLALGDDTAVVGGKKETGAVVVVWGTAKGLDPTNRAVITQNTPYVAARRRRTTASARRSPRRT